MKVKLGFISSVDGEQDYMLPMELPELPRKGDLISVTRNNETGSEDFIVKDVRWNLQFDDSKDVGKPLEVWVLCEFAETYWSKDTHKANCKRNGSNLKF